MIAEQYIRSCALRLRQRTLRRYAENLEVFLRFVVATKRDPYHASLLSKPLLEDFYGWLLEPANGLHGRQRSADTARKIVEVAQLMWAWAEDSDRWPDQIPRPRKIQMVRKRPRSVRAPTWEEMDACVGAATGWQRKLLTVLRYTGLRVGEAMQLEWDDLDFRQGTLFIRAEISKNREEREVFVTPHLLTEVGGWGVREGYLIPSGRRTEKRYRQPRARDVARAWARAGVSRRVWEGSPHHAFRRGFKSEMMRAGAPPDAVDYLQGHIPKGGRGRYIDMHRAFDWGEVVGMIPSTTRTNAIPMNKGASGA